MSTKELREFAQSIIDAADFIDKNEMSFASPPSMFVQTDTPTQIDIDATKKANDGFTRNKPSGFQTLSIHAHVLAYKEIKS